MNWRATTLGEVADVNWGDTSVTKASYVDRGYPAYSASGNDGFLPYADYNRNAIVLSAIGARCGKTWFATGQWSCIKNTIRFWSTSPEVDDRFLYWITANEKFWPRRGAAQPFITIGDARNIPIKIPPITYQQRITSILDAADALRAKRFAALSRLDTIAISIFTEMFGNCRCFDWRPLGSLCTKIGSGATPTGGEAAYQESGIPFVRSMNVRDGAFSTDGLAYLDSGQASLLDNVILESNDVLLNITGASVARVCMAPEYVVGGRVNQHVAIIRPKHGIIEPEFLERFLLMQETRRKLLRIAEVGATRQAITKTQLEEFEVPVPNIDEQRQFTKIKKSLAKLMYKTNIQAKQLSELFLSLQDRAFRGEL